MNFEWQVLWIITDKKLKLIGGSPEFGSNCTLSWDEMADCMFCKSLYNSSTHNMRYLYVKSDYNIREDWFICIILCALKEH